MGEVLSGSRLSFEVDDMLVLACFLKLCIVLNFFSVDSGWILKDLIVLYILDKGRIARQNSELTAEFTGLSKIPIKGTSHAPPCVPP